MLTVADILLFSVSVLCSGGSRIFERGFLVIVASYNS